MLWLLCPDAGMELCGKMRRHRWPGQVLLCRVRCSHGPHGGARHTLLCLVSPPYIRPLTAHTTHHVCVSHSFYTVSWYASSQLTSCSVLTRQTRSTHSWAQPSPFRPAASKTTKYQRIWEIHTRAIFNEENEVNLPNYVSSFDDLIAAEILNILLSWDLGPPQVPR